MGTVGEASLRAIVPTVPPSYLAYLLKGKVHTPQYRSGKGLKKPHRKGWRRAGGAYLEMAVVAPWPLHVLVSYHLKMIARYWAAWFKKRP